MANKLKKMLKLFKRPDWIWLYFSRRGMMNWMSDETYLKQVFRIRMKKKLDLEDPKTFNEKLQWIKLYHRNPEHTKWVDKYAVREYISQTIGEEYLIPLIGVWDHFDDIDFDALPEQFVLKCTHDSGSVVICRDKAKLDRAAARKRLERALKHNGYGYGREWPYKNVKPRIIAEKLMIDDSGYELKDYKFFCFDGTVRCFKIDFDRFVGHKANYFDPEGNLLPFGEEVCMPDFSRKLEMPTRLTEMLELASRLSKGTPFLRVDFYEVNGQIYFGELTFFPASGFGPFCPPEWDRTFGDWMELKRFPEK